jgi:hypothetical protein
MKVCPVGADLFHADGRMDGRTDGNVSLVVAFRNFANAPKNGVHGHRQHSELKNVQT